MNKKAIWYKKRWVKLLYRRDIIINEDSLFFNILLEKHWNLIEFDHLYYHFDLCLDFFNEWWQYDFLFENFYELYKSFQMLIVNNNYLRFFFLLKIFFFFFEKESIPLLVRELIQLNFKELSWIIFSLKTYVNQLSNLKLIWKHFLQLNIRKGKFFRKKWNLVWNLLWAYEDKKIDSQKYKLNQIIVWFNLYFWESIFSKMIYFVFKNWCLSFLDCLNILNPFLNIKQNFLYLSNYKFLEIYNYLNKENFVFLESKHFLEQVTYYTTFRKLNWTDLYFKLKFKQQVINY